MLSTHYIDPKRVVKCIFDDDDDDISIVLGMPPPMGMRPPPPGFIPPPMPYSAVLSKPPEISKQLEEGMLHKAYILITSID